MFYVTDAITLNRVALSPDHIVAVFKIVEGEQSGKTGINLVNGSIVCLEEDYAIVAEIKNSKV
jgi:hypothetical protein